MLLDFTVQNYRSFGRECSVSMVASSDKQLLETNTGATGNKSIPRIVRTAVIYGANASGKSNLLRGLQLMRGVVLESARLRPEQNYNVQPFLLDKTLKTKPTLFEVTIILDSKRYQYGFEFTPTRIIREWLLVYENAKPQKWIDRRYNFENDKEVFEFSSHLLGQKRSWQEATRPNALFLSTAVQLNSDQLRPLYNWFAESLVVLLDGGNLIPDHSTNMVQTREGHEAIRSLLSSADITISAISVVPKKGFTQTINFDAANGKSEATSIESEFLVPEFTHEVAGVSANFGLQDESHGTQKLFALLGPLIDIIKEGKVLVIDELDRSLHPLLVRQIVQTFQDSSLNRSSAQLLFSTHDTSLLDNELFRRDQIWLTEKQTDQSSKLVSLSEFSPRKNEAFEKGYLSGRYGGVPILDPKMNTDGFNGKK